ncbi:MAG: phosphatidylglycerophosphatase A [Vicinamibacteria bacterium]|nr:phosphatidylglycerophosphatase A [Vicinamibacteria bacterium]
MMRLALFVCTFGYIGYFPIAPGTVGSAAGVVVYGLLRALGASPIVDLGVIAALFVAGVWSGTLAEQHFGGTDPGPGVVDEVVGMLVTLWALPETWTLVIVAFVVFRILDIIKPWPASRFEALHGGLGMMADDVMAAIYGNLLLRGALLVLPALGGA